MSGILGAMTNTPQQPPAGWYPDPAGSGGERFWDGVAWSQSTRQKVAPQPTPTPSAGTPAGYGSPSPHVGQQQPYSGYGQQPYAQNYGQQPYGAQQGYGSADSGRIPRLAGFWWRVLGYFIDGLVVGVVNWIVASAIGLNARMMRLIEQWLNDVIIWSENQSGPAPELSPELTGIVWQVTMVQTVIWIIYRILMYRTKAATLGMMAVGTRLVPASDENATLSWGTIIVRAIASPVLYAITLVSLVNGIMAAFTARKQTLADMIAKTLVLKIR